MIPAFDTDSFIANYLPPNYRLQKVTAFFRTLLSALRWRMGVFTGYTRGEMYTTWDAATAYSAGTPVQWNFATWESLADGNTGNTPGASPDKWIQRNASFIGAMERAAYNGRYLQLTYELNRYFSYQLSQLGLPGFIQPPWPAPYGGGPAFSSIYITNKPVVYASFLAAPDGGGGSAAGPHGSTGYATDVAVFTTASSYGYIIWFPLAAYNALGATDEIRQAIISRFVSRYNTSGTGFSISTYY